MINCSIKSCVKPAKARGWCNNHWYRWKKFGDPLQRTNKDPNELRTDGDISYVVLYKNHAPIAEAIIDTEDIEKIKNYRWCFTDGYAKSGSKNVQMHEVIMGGKRMDHINRNRLDNRKTNLRPATHQQNQRNFGVPRHNTSGFRGVYETKEHTWAAQISYNNWPIHLGRFKTAEEAAYVYDQAAIQLAGEFAFTNFSY